MNQNVDKGFQKPSKRSYKRKGQKKDKSEGKIENGQEEDQIELEEEYIRFNQDKPKKTKKIIKKQKLEMKEAIIEDQFFQNFENERAKVFSYTGRRDQYKNVIHRCLCGKCLSHRTQHKCQVYQEEYIRANNGSSGKSATRYCIKCFQIIKGKHKNCQGINKNINLALLQNTKFGQQLVREFELGQCDTPYNKKIQYLRILTLPNTDFDSKLFVQYAQKKKVVGEFRLNWMVMKQQIYLIQNRNMLINLLAAIVSHVLNKNKIYLNELFKFTFPGFRNFITKIPYGDIFSCLGDAHYSAWQIQKQVLDIIKESNKLTQQFKILKKYQGKTISQIELFQEFQNKGLNLREVEFLFVKSVPYVITHKERLKKILQIYIPKEIIKNTTQRLAISQFTQIDFQKNYDEYRTIAAIYDQLRQAVKLSVQQGQNNTGEQNYCESYSMPIEQIRKYLQGEKEQKKQPIYIESKPRYAQLACYLQDNLKKMFFFEDIKYFRSHKNCNGFKQRQYWQAIIKDYDKVDLNKDFIDNNLFFQVRYEIIQKEFQGIQDSPYNQLMYTYVAHKQKLYKSLQLYFSQKKKIMKYFTLEDIQKIYEQNVFCQIRTPSKFYRNGQLKYVFLTFKQFLQRAINQQFFKRISQDHDLYRIDSNLISTFKDVRDYGKKQVKKLYSFVHLLKPPSSYEIQIIQLNKRKIGQRTMFNKIYKKKEVSQRQVYMDFIQKNSQRFQKQQLLEIILTYFLKINKKKTWMQIKQILTRFQNQYLKKQFKQNIQWYQILIRLNITKLQQNQILRQRFNCDFVQQPQIYTKLPYIPERQSNKNTGQWLSIQTLQLLPSTNRMKLIQNQSKKIQNQFENIKRQHYTNFKMFLTDKKHNVKNILQVDKEPRQILFSLWREKYGQNMIKYMVVKKQNQLNHARIQNDEIQRFLNSFDKSNIRAIISRIIQNQVMSDIQLKLLKLPQIRKIINNQNISNQMLKLYQNAKLFEDNVMCMNYLSKIYSQRQIENMIMVESDEPIQIYQQKFKAAPQVFKQCLSKRGPATHFALLLQFNYLIETNKYNQIFNLQTISEYYSRKLNFQQSIKMIKQLFCGTQKLKQVQLYLQEQIQIQNSNQSKLKSIAEQKLIRYKQMILQDQDLQFWRKIQIQKKQMNMTGGGRKLSSSSSPSSESQQSSISSDQRQFLLLKQMIQDQKKVFCKACKKEHTNLQYKTQNQARQIIAKNRRQMNQKQRNEGNQEIPYNLVNKHMMWKQMEQKNIKNIYFRFAKNNIYLQQRQRNQNGQLKNIVHFTTSEQQLDQNFIYQQLPSCGSETIDMNLPRQEQLYDNIFQNSIKRAHRLQDLRRLKYNQWMHQQKQQEINQYMEQLLLKPRIIQIEGEEEKPLEEQILEAELQNSENYGRKSLWGQSNLKQRRYLIDLVEEKPIQKEKLIQKEKPIFKKEKAHILKRWYQPQSQSQVIQIEVQKQQQQINHVSERRIQPQSQSQVIQIEVEKQEQPITLAFERRIQSTEKQQLIQISSEQPQHYGNYEAQLTFAQGHNCSRCKSKYVPKKDNRGVQKYFRCRNISCRNSATIEYRQAKQIQKPLKLKFRIYSIQQMIQNDNKCSKIMQMKIKTLAEKNNLRNYVQNPQNDWTFSKQIIARGYLANLNLFTRAKILSKVNRQIVNQYYKKFDYLPIHIKKCAIQQKGLGVFASSNIQNNTIIAIYTGQAYIDFECPFHEKNDSVLRVGWVTILEDKMDFQVLLNPQKYRDIGRYLNSSQKPNCIGFWAMMNEKPLYILKTLKKVRVGSQLTWNYGAFGQKFE